MDKVDLEDFEKSLNGENELSYEKFLKEFSPKRKEKLEEEAKESEKELSSLDAFLDDVSEDLI